MTVDRYHDDGSGIYYVLPARRTGAEIPEKEQGEAARLTDPGGPPTLDAAAFPPSPTPPSEPWTLDRLWAAYQAANPSLKGMSVYRAIYGAHVRPLFGHVQPSEISAFDLDRLRLEHMRGRSVKSVANALELLRRLANFGTRRGLCAGPPVPILLPRVSNEKTEDLSREELARLVSVLDRHIETGSSCAAGAAMMMLALLTGMRRGEMFRLKWADLDFHRSNIRLREPKGGRDVIIPMSSQARWLLEFVGAAGRGTLAAQGRRLGEKGALGAGNGRRGKDEGGGDIRFDHADLSYRASFVFPGRGGAQRRDVRGQVNRIKAEAGLPDDFRPLHGLRHVFASGLISSGVEFQIVSRLLTHKGGTVTHRYAHIRDDALRAAAELAGELAERVRGAS